MMTHLHAGLSSETTEKARVELNENPETLHQDIQQVLSISGGWFHYFTRPSSYFLDSQKVVIKDVVSVWFFWDSGHDCDKARYRFLEDRWWFHPPLPESPEIRPGGNLQTAGPVLPVQTTEPWHVPEFQGVNDDLTTGSFSCQTVVCVSDSVWVCVRWMILALNGHWWMVSRVFWRIQTNKAERS